MTADNLLLLLQQPEGLRRVSYEELKTLALEYPYCPHVHQLLLFKSRLSDHREFTVNLASAAAHHVDRPSLRHRLKDLEAILLEAQAPLHDEVFELKPLAELEERLTGARNISPLEIQRQQDVTQRKTLAPPAENLSSLIQPEMETPPADPDFAAEPVSAEDPGETGLSAAPANDTLQDADILLTPEPMSKAAFRTWKRRQPLTLQHLPPLGTEERKEPSAAPVALPPAQPEQAFDLPDLRHLAERSVEEKQDVASESLAALLARQGHIHKAIEMYERLRLHFPEKSAYFAAQIENLKKTS